MHTFDDTIWERIIQHLAQQNDVIWTLSQNKKNRVNEVLEDGLLVTTIHEPKKIEKQWIATAWNKLIANGKLQASDIPGQGRHRSSFIMALLHLLPEVHIDKSKPRPLTLMITLK